MSTTEDHTTPAASAPPPAGAEGESTDRPAEARPTTEAEAAEATEATEAQATEEHVVEPAKRRRGRPKGSGARTTRTVELALTVTGTADGEWQAELKQGTTWLSRGLPVSAAAVSRAAQELHAELAGPIDAVIDAARQQRASRVAELEAELEQARKALAEIEE